MVKKEGKNKHQIQPVSLIAMVDPSSPISEQYRTVRTNIQFASTVDRRIQTIAVTSAGPGEGKSTSAANLAIVFAKSGQRVLLVDADMRKPSVYKTFQLGNGSGLSSVLSTGLNITNSAQESQVPNLFVLTSGPKPPNPSELLGSTRMDQIIEEAKVAFDIVIFDMPPIVAVTDAQIMASKVEGTLLVVRENVTKKEQLQKAKQLLDMVNANVIGAIYNGAEVGKDNGYYYYYSN